jgi:hypothetical protein
VNRSYLAKRTINPTNPTDIKEFRRKTAIHEAGHAAAIYLGNRQKQLPPIYFQIYIAGFSHNTPSATARPQWVAKVDGGRLIHTLPSSVEEATRDFSPTQKQAYLNAFEADITSLLVGPLAEANYIALRDDEIINSRLVNLDALYQYGGEPDLKLAEEYLDCLTHNPAQREQKIAELFAAAFNFINDGANWRAIMGLANVILAYDKPVIGCEEIIAVLDAQSNVRRKAA